MDIIALGYVGIDTDDLVAWEDFGSSFLGLQKAEQSSKTLSFRMDDRSQRIHVDCNGKRGIQYLGWEARNSDSLQALAARLEAHGVAVHHGDGALAQQRKVRELIWFQDPAGNRLEVFYGQEIATSPFIPGRQIGGFRTGPLGLGHAALTCEKLEVLLPFYKDILGFHVSDYMFEPFKGCWMHINPRHHSLALVEIGRNSAHHLMMELANFDDVGHAYDLAHMRPEKIGTTLGRHTNDYMTSFYTFTPSGFMIEYGWGGREIDPRTHTPTELIDGPSVWGHYRSWLSGDAKLREAEKLKQNAYSGLNRPIQVMPGNHELMTVDSLWWDNLLRQDTAI